MKHGCRTQRSRAGHVSLVFLRGDPSWLAVLITGSASFVMAQNTPPPAAAGKGSRGIRCYRDHDTRMHGIDHQGSGVIGDLAPSRRL